MNLYEYRMEYILDDEDDPFMLAIEAQDLYNAQKSEEAIVLIDRILQLEPTYKNIYYLKGLCYLSLGDFKRGWPIYLEYLSSIYDHRPWNWFGEETFERVIIYADEGFGDCIQFARYIPLVKKRCPNLQLIAKDSLVTLFRSSFPDVDVVPFSGPVEGLLCPLTNLAHIFKTIPHKVPYLRPTLALLKKPAKIGVCWTSEIAIERLENNLEIEKGVERIIPDHLSEKLLQIPDTMSLQHKDLQTKDWEETAAIVNSLDLVISIDASIAHLAGALGKPTWLLLSHNHCEWRWMRERTDSLWYPSMKLIRQKPENSGDWEEVIQEVINGINT